MGSLLWCNPIIFLLWHWSHFLTNSLTSSLILFQNINLLIFSRVLFSPRCPPCNGSSWYSASTLFFNFSGTRTLNSPFSFAKTIPSHSLHFSFSPFSAKSFLIRPIYSSSFWAILMSSELIFFVSFIRLISGVLSRVSFSINLLKWSQKLFLFPGR
ncbi:unnamed protein product [Meloidogyne enterolobii]|uniref:Uncharacterized protein n=1 Tax=Meloidogyne enterolobii TaxID=390850 RepID=A0ACB0Z3N1_MELEN